MYYEGERALKEKGEAALKRMPPMRTAQKAGVVVGAGTDAHRVADYNPFVALLTTRPAASSTETVAAGVSATPLEELAGIDVIARWCGTWMTPMLFELAAINEPEVK